jgi:hypothetical protein
VEDERLARMELAKATRIAQEMTQANAQEAIRVKQDATANSKKAKKGERYQATMEKLGKPPPCPILCRGEECSGSPCAEEEETGLSYSHMDGMVVCQDKSHVSMATSTTCLMFHKWPPRKKSPKPAKNGGGGTSGARPPPRQPPQNNNGNPRAGKPRQGTQPWQQQSDITHRRAMERLNLQLEVARANAGTRSVSYANVVKGMPPFSTPTPNSTIHHPPSPQLSSPCQRAKTTTNWQPY